MLINYGGADNDTSEIGMFATILKVINYYNPYCEIIDPSTDITVAGNVSHYMVRANGEKGITNIIFKDAIETESGRQITETSFENSCDLSFGANEITVAAKYFFGNGLSATVNIMRTGAADSQPPELTVISPFDYWITNISAVEIIAKAYDANGIYSVKFDSQQGNYIGQSNFVGNVLLAENTNEIVVIAEDNAENPSTNFHHVIIDTIMPDIIIFNPETELKAVEGNVAAYTVRAFADDNYGIIDVSFLTNGAFLGKADIHNGTNYEKRINLTFNTNVISVVARDMANNVKTNTVRIVRKSTGGGDFTAPTTTITEPATSPIIVHSNWYCVRGTAIDPSGICSGLFENTDGPDYYSALTITSSCFSSDIQLIPKTNSIIMRAWDNADNSGQSTTKLIIYDLPPFVQITSSVSIVGYEVTSIDIAGTNNEFITGPIWWTNTLNNTFGTEVGTPWIASVPLAEGLNTIIVTGSNIWNEIISDTTTVFRISNPFINITNVPTIVAYNQTTESISGTNINISGQLWMVTDRHPETTNWFAQGFSTTVTNLEHGNNVITVFGTNSYNLQTNDSVNIYRETLDDVAPFIDITNSPTSVSYSQTTAEIIGTNLNIYGQLGLVTDCHPETTNWFAQGFSTTVINLEHGTNTITVFGTNSYNFPTNDTVNIYRETLDDVRPFIDIINSPAVVAALQTTAVISGTNLNIAAQLGLVTDRHPETTNWFAQGFSTTVINLEPGNNLITVFGTNSYNFSTNDTVNIYRETLDDVRPFIDITNTPLIVTYPQTTAEISGTNLSIYGQIWLVTDRHPETTNWFAQGFSTIVTNLEHGTNVITVFGTNSYNFQTNDTVSIYRETWEEVRPFIDITNPPTSVSYSQTTAEISGTNLNIYGQLGLVSDRHPEITNWFSQGFSTTINLEQGNNVITVFGTNSYNFQTNEIVNIYRETWEKVKPFIDITNLPTIVLNQQITEISGTNLNIVGNMTWSNSLVDGETTFMPSGDAFAVNITNLIIGDNEIFVFGTNEFGSVSDSITIKSVPLIIVIQNPLDATTSQVQNVTISGNVYGNFNTNVTVNSQTAIGSNIWLIDFDLVAGDNLIEAIAINGDNVATDTIHVVYDPSAPVDTNPPTIIIQSPLDNITSQVQNVTISGIANDNINLSNVTVNGISSYGLNNWLVNLNLVAGDNLIEAIATDNSGNATTTTINIIYAPLPPIVTITAPNGGSNYFIKIGEHSTNIFGTVVEAADQPIIWSNSLNNSGGSVPAGNSFAISNVFLALGDNIIEVYATLADFTSSNSITITVIDKKPNIEVTFPTNWTTYSVTQSIDITGIVTDDDKDVVSITRNGTDITAQYNYPDWTDSILLNHGTNTYTYIAIDADGLAATDIVNYVVGDFLPPYIEVLDPNDWTTYIFPTNISVAGLATDNVAVVSITRNGTDITSDYSAPNWTNLISAELLERGTNIFNYIAYDGDSLSTTATVKYVVLSNTIYSTPVQVLETWPRYIANDQTGTVEFISNRNSIWKLFVVNVPTTNILIASGNCTQGWNLVEFYGGNLPSADSDVENQLQLVVGKDSNHEILSAFSVTVVDDLNKFGNASLDFDGDQIYVQYKGTGNIDIKGRTINIENGTDKDKLTIKIKAAKGTGDGVAAICGIFSNGDIKMIKHAGDLDRLQIDGVMSKLMISGGNLGRSNGTVRYNVKFNSLATKSKSSITLKAGKNKYDKTTIMANCFANILVGELKSEPNTVESLAGLKTLKISGGNLGVDNIAAGNTYRHWISAKYAGIIMAKPVKKTSGGNLFDYSFYFTGEDMPTKGSFNKFFFNGVIDSSDNNNNVAIVCGFDDKINPIEITGTNWIGQNVNYGFGKIITKNGLQGTGVIKKWGKGKSKQVSGPETARWIVDGLVE